MRLRKVCIIGMILTTLIVLSGCTFPPVATESNERVTPKSMNVKDFSLVTEDGLTMSVSHFLSGLPNVCILAHGFMGSKRRPYITVLSKSLSKQFDIITFDFRGHGASGGVVNGMNEIYDVKRVVDYAKNNGYEKIALIGFSLGGIQSIYEAAKFHDIDVLVTVSVPADAETIKFKAKWLCWIVSNQFGRIIVRPLARLGDVIKFPKPVTVIEQVSPIPLLIIQGTEDSLVDVEQAEILYVKAKEPKELVIIDRMGHPPKLPEEFYETVEKWLRKLLK